MATDFILLDPGDQIYVTLDWSNDTSASILLVNVVHTLPSPLANLGQVTNPATSQSQVKIGSVLHGGVYMIEAEATLSNGEIINRQWPVRGFNS